MRLHDEDPQRSARSIAEETGLDHKTVSGAVEATNPTTKPKKSNGLDGDGEIPHTAKKTRAKRGASKIKLAPGKTLEEMVREGIKLEDAGASTEQTAGTVGLDTGVYGRLRDLILLLDNEAAISIL